MVRAKKRHSTAARITSKLFIKPVSVKPVAAAQPPSIDKLPVNQKQCRQAVDALVAHAKKRIAEKANSDLLADEESEAVWLGVTLKQMLVALLHFAKYRKVFSNSCLLHGETS